MGETLGQGLSERLCEMLGKRFGEMLCKRLCEMVDTNMLQVYFDIRNMQKKKKYVKKIIEVP